MEKLKSAVIGCGRMGAFTSAITKKYGPKCWFPNSHIEALKEIKNISLDGICDLDNSLLKNAADKYGVKNIYSNFDELFNNHKIDLLCVATRTRDRFKIIKAGIENGVKAFHVEKPLCNSMEQLNKLESIISEKNIYLSYGTLRRYLNIYHQAKALVDSGRFGKLLQIQINFGAGALFWTHPHSVDMILFFSGNRKLKAVQSHLTNVSLADENIIDTDPIIEQSMMYFDDGLVGSISKIRGMDVVLSCENGTITLEANGGQITIKKPNNDSPYFECSEKLIKDNCNTPQGTYSAICDLITNMNNKHPDKHLFIFLGQKVLFGFVESHLNSGKLINIDNVSDKIIVLGKMGTLYA
jgi:scyllo-inositol 2-dehydrogenase (NAD+)